MKWWRSGREALLLSIQKRLNWFQAPFQIILTVGLKDCLLVIPKNSIEKEFLILPFPDFLSVQFVFTIASEVVEAT